MQEITRRQALTVAAATGSAVVANSDSKAESPTGTQHKKLLGPPWTDALCIAACRGMLDEMRLLIEQGTDLNGRSIQHQCNPTPLTSAVRHDQTEAALLLLSLGADANATCGDDQSALMLAVTSKDNPRQLELIDTLLAAGASVDDRRTDDRFGEQFVGQTALHAAAYRCGADVIGRLIDAGGSVDVVSKSGKTPLMIAAEHQNFEGHRTLLKYGAT